MNIVHITATFKYGGIETMLVNIVNEQINHATITVVLINNLYDQSLLDSIDKRVKIIKINRPIKSINPWYFIKLNLLIMQLKPDVIHVHNPNLIRFLTYSLVKKSVGTIHNIPQKKHVLFYRMYKKRFAISHSVQDSLKMYNIDSKLVTNGIATDAFEKDSSVHKSIFKIVQIGRLEHAHKGQDVAIEAMRVLIEKGVTDIALDFIGSGSSEAYLKSLVEKYGLQKHISFLGSQSQNYIQKNLKNYSLFIQPSRYEGFGLTVAEAMAAKVPVLVSNIQGPMEIIKSGEYGFYFESENIDSMVRVIEQIKSNPNLSDLKTRALYHVESNYSVKRTAMEYLKAY